MRNNYNRLTAKQTLRLILCPMLATFVCQRLYLHLVRVQHVYPAGYLVHHLFFGALIVVPAAFILAFGTRNRVLGLLVPVALPLLTPPPPLVAPPARIPSSPCYTGCRAAGATLASSCA